MSSKTKILFFVPSFPVLSETFIENEIDHIKRKSKFDVKVISLNKTSDFINDFTGDYTHYIKLSTKDIIYGFIDNIGNKALLMATLQESLKNTNRTVIDNLYIWIKSVGFSHIFKKYSPDLIFSHFLSESSTITHFVCRLLKCKHIISGHAVDVFGKTAGAIKNCELLEEKVKYASYLVVCNKKAYEFLLTQLDSKYYSKIKMIYHGVPVSKYIITEEQETPGEFLYLGRFVEKKGLEYLIDASKIIRDQKIEHTVLLIGYGLLYKPLLATVKELNLSDTVLFINEGKGLPRNQADDYFRKCMCFVIPSIDLDNSDSDGVPNTILEAGIYKKPVITTNAGGISELIMHAKNGIVVNQKDPQSLADEMIKIIKDVDLRKKLGANLYSSVKEKFDMDRNSEELIKLIELS